MSFVLTGNLGSGPGPSGDLATEILVRRVEGSGSGLVEVTVAVPEDLSPTAQFNIDGWAAQNYRISDRARRVIALVPGDSPSWPRQPGVLRVAVGEGQVPSEAGTFPTIDLSAIKLILGVDGTQYEAGLADAIHTNVVAPVGPGHRGQVGPDLLRREHYLLRLKRQGVSGPGTETTDYVTVADVHVTRRVDKKVVEFIVHWMNGAWRSTDNTFQPSPASSGHVFFDFLRIATASIPAGYAVEMFAPHPTSFANEVNIFMVSSAPANEVHGIYPGGQCVTRFAIYETATVAPATARRIVRGFERGRTISGPLSFHHRHAYGGRRDLIVDLQAFDRGPGGEELQWRDPKAPTVDIWQRLDTLCEASVASLRQAHSSGQQINDLQFVTTRRGWHYPLGLEPNAAPSGELVYGTSAIWQAQGAYEINMLHLDGLSNRLGIAVIDLVDGRCCSDDKLASNNSAALQDLTGATPGAAGRLPYQMSLQDRKAFFLHPHMVPADAFLASPWGDGNPNQFKLAPSNRSWNAPPSGKTCPYFPVIYYMGGGGEMLWAPFQMSHISRAIPAIEHGVWMYDDPVAHRLLEQMACTRIMCAIGKHPVQGHVAQTFGLIQSNIPHILATITSPDGFGWYRAQSVTMDGANMRIWAWAMHFALMYWETCSSAERTRIHPPLGAAGVSWFRGLWEFLRRFCLSNGYGGRFDDVFGFPSPDPFTVGQYGSTNMVERTGSFPGPNNTTGPPGLHYSAVSLFHAMFLAGECFAVKHGPLKNEPQASQLDHQISVARALAGECRAMDTGQFKRPSKYPLITLASQGIQDTPLTPQEIASGIATWYLLRIDGAKLVEDRLKSFQGWSSTYGYRDTGDISMFEVTAYDHGAQPESLTSIFMALSAHLTQTWDDASNKFRLWPADDHTWWIGTLAEVIHLREGRTD